MDFHNKIKADRALQSSSSDLQSALESDRGRIINSAAVRRLQQKTQVFPLERNAAVRSRLTHSLEVQQTGRFIVQTVFRLLSEQQQAEYGLTALERPIESLVEMACLHKITFQHQHRTLQLLDTAGCFLGQLITVSDTG